jgi:hypothetical protein
MSSNYPQDINQWNDDPRSPFYEEKANDICEVLNIEDGLRDSAKGYLVECIEAAYLKGWNEKSEELNRKMELVTGNQL